MAVNYTYEVHTRNISAKCPIIYITCYSSGDLDRAHLELEQAGFQHVETTKIDGDYGLGRFRTAEQLTMKYLKARNDIVFLIDHCSTLVLIYVREHILTRSFPTGSFPFLLQAYENEIGSTLAKANHLPSVESKKRVYMKARELAAEATELGLVLREEYRVQQIDKRLQDPDFLELLEKESSEIWDRILAAGRDTEPRMGLPD